MNLLLTFLGIEERGQGSKAKISSLPQRFAEKQTGQ